LVLYVEKIENAKIFSMNMIIDDFYHSKKKKKKKKRERRKKRAKEKKKKKKKNRCFLGFSHTTQNSSKALENKCKIEDI
jgi:protoporphyrinogen oxidase